MLRSPKICEKKILGKKIKRKKKKNEDDFSNSIYLFLNIFNSEIKYNLKINTRIYHELDLSKTELDLFCAQYHRRS